MHFSPEQYAFRSILGRITSHENKRGVPRGERVGEVRLVTAGVREGHRVLHDEVVVSPEGRAVLRLARGPGWDQTK